MTFIRWTTKRNRGTANLYLLGFVIAFQGALELKVKVDTLQEIDLGTC